MLISTQKLIKGTFQISLIFLFFTYFSNVGFSQCGLSFKNIIDPSSCYAYDGSFEVLATGQAGNPCKRLIQIFKNDTLLIQGLESIKVTGINSGDYKVIAHNDCGCQVLESKMISVSGGTPTKLTPHVNLGFGSYQSNYVGVCRGANVNLGLQSLGLTNLLISGPNGYADATPDGSTFWTLTNVQPSQSGLYTIRYTNVRGCISTTSIMLNVGGITVNAGPDKVGCIGTEHNIQTTVTGQAICRETCPANLDSLLVNWTLDQCNASTQNHQLDYSEFTPSYPSLGNCTSASATNLFRLQGEHSCTPVNGSYAGDVGICVPAMNSCDPADYNSDNAIRFEVTLTPAEAGRITGFSFNEQSPFDWMTTNGSKGKNNYNTKYLIRVYKNDLLIYSEDDRLTERTWNVENFDFSTNPDFAIKETAVFRFELRGYCVNNVGGNMSGWEVDNIKVFGGCCSGLSSNDAFSYLWSTGDTTSNIVVNPSTTTSYGVTVTDCKGCQHSDTVLVRVNSLPIANINGILSICTGGSTVLTASGGTSYIWSTGETSASISLTPTITQSYSVTVTDGNGCQSSASATVIVNPLPSPTISGDLEICLGESTTLTASGGMEYEWSTGETTASITVSPSTNTTYMVMAKDINGCQDYTTVIVLVRPVPSAQISGDNVICISDSTSLLASGGSSYLWSNGMTSASIKVSPIVNTDYVVTVSNIFGCFDTASISVTVNPLPIAIISGNNSFCVGKSSLLTASGGVSYEWSTGAVTTSIMVNPGLNTTYTVTVTDVNGCTATASRMASVMSLPDVNINGEDQICEGSSVLLTATGGVQFLWNTGEIQNVIYVTPSTTTTYKVTVTDTNGCTGTSAYAVVVNPNPELEVSGSDEFCIGGSATLTANVTGTTICQEDCEDELLLIWNLDACNANGANNQNNYEEFTSISISNGGMSSVTGSSLSRERGDHSCTPDGNGGAGLCFGVLESCDPNNYNPINGLKFSVVLDPNETGSLTKLTFREQSPLIWVTTNGSSGINDYNEKYLIRVYKNGELVFSQNELSTERVWNVETFDFSNHAEFNNLTTTTTFTFELYGYCTVDRGGNMPGWELDDIKIYGGECPSSLTIESSSYLWSTGDTTAQIIVTPNETTTYTVTVTDCNGCSATDSAVVTIFPLPIVSITGLDAICLGDSTSLTASGGNQYVWSNGATTAEITVSPTETTTYSVTVTDSNNCENTSQKTITVNPKPIPVIVGDTEICLGDTAVLYGSGGGSYLWSTGGTTFSISVTPIVTTSYSLTITNAFLCSDSAVTTVIVNPLPEVSIIGNTVLCLGESTTLTASGGNIYNWSNGSTTASITVNPSITTTYTVTVTDLNGCSETSSIQVIVNPLPTIIISGDTEICIGDNTTLTASGGSAYIWNTGDTTAAINVAPSVNTNYSVTVTNINGCNDSANVTLIVNPLPIVTIIGDTEICRGQTTSLTASGGTIYNWSNGASTPNIDVNLDETTTYTVVVTDGNGCVNTGTVTVTVNPLPVVAISGDTEICVGESTTLTASGGSSYTWSNGATTASITVNPIVTTTYGVTVSDGNGCESTGSVTVIVNPLPTPTIVGDTEICLGESTNLGVFGGVSYVWSNGSTTAAINVSPLVTTLYSVTVTDGKGCSAVASTTVRVNPLPNAAITGDTEICVGEETTLYASGGASYVWSNGETTYWIDVNPVVTTTYSVTVTDVNGCKASTSTTVTVNPLPVVTISGDTEICVGESTTLTASGGSNYSWSNGATTASIEVSPSVTTTYNVVVTDGNGCRSTSSVTVIVNPLPIASISGDNAICIGDNTTLTASGGSSYVWSTGATTSSINVSPIATTSYGVTVTDGAGCTSSANITVTVNPLPVVTISGETEICLDECTELTAEGGLSYEWLGLGENGYTCEGAFYVGGQQGGAIQSLYTIKSDNTLNEVGSLGTNNVNGIGYYCESGNRPYIYGMKMVGTSITEAVRANFVRINPETAAIDILGEIPQPPNPYGITGTTGIMAFIADVSDEGVYYFPAVAALINPFTFEIVDYTIYLGKIDVNNHGNGSNVTYTPLGVQASCQAYMDACIAAFQAYALNPSGGEPSGGIQDWALSPDGQILYSFFGIENGLFSLDINTNSVSCVAGPSGNEVYTGQTGAQTDEFGGIYFSEGELFGLQVDRGRLYSINIGSGALTLVNNNLPINFRGDNARCYDCGNIGTGGGATSESVIVCPDETTTYTVVVTDGNGCVNTGTVTVTVNPLPVVAISGDTEICVGESTTLTASGGSSYTWSNGATTASITVNPIVTTTYGVTVSDGNGCESTGSVTVIVNPLPTPTIVGDTEICLGESTNLGVFGGVSYVWSNGSTTAAINVSPLVTTLYSVTVTDGKGCSAVASTTVRVNPLPNAAITGDTEICVGEETTLYASGGASYVWSNGETTYWIDVNPVVTTTYSVTVTDVNGCKASTSTTVTVNPLPVVTISGDTEICVGESTTLTASGGSNYSWSNGATTASIEVSPSVTTTYNVVVTDGNGCRSTSSVTVIVNPLPIASISGDNAICIGDNTTLTASGGSSYVWSTGATTSSINVSPIATTSYGVTVTDGAGCTSSANITVTVNPLPVVTISGETEICLDECTELTAEGGLSYEWLGLGENGYTCEGAFYVGGQQGGAIQSLYTIKSDNTLNEVGSLGTNNVNGIGYYCESGNRPYIYGMKMVGTSITEAVRANFVRINPETAAIDILGEIPQPPNPYGITGTTGIMAFIADVSDEGVYYFPAVAALINPFTFEIVDYTIYLGKIDVNNHGNGSNVTYTPLGVQASCQAYMDACIAAFQAYALNPSGGEPSGGIQDWALSPDGQILYSFFGIENGLFSLDINTNSVSCVAGPSGNEVYTGQTGAQTDEFGGIYFSEGELFGLQVDRGRLYSINIGSGALTLVNNNLPINFRGDNARCYDCGNIGTGGGATSESVIVCPDETTTYTVVVTDGNGCVNTGTVTVTVNPLPVVTISGDTEICLGESTTLTASGGSNYIWSNGATTTSITVNPIVTTTYGVTVSDGNGCESTGSVTVIVNPLPTPTIVGDTEICLGESTNLGVFGGVSYVWSNGSTTAAINVSPLVTTLYSVTVTDGKGCSAVVSTTVTVNPLPNAAITGNTEICVGEETTLYASGGASYVWSNGETTYWIDVNPLVTTTYSVTVTDVNGCKASTSTTVTVNPLPVVTISGDTEICVGESTTLTASGGNNYTWSNGATTASIEVSPSVTTTYNVVVTDGNGCRSTSSVTVIVNPLPIASISGDNAICIGDNTTLTASGGTSYVWSTGATTASINVSPIATTSYGVTVTDGAGCTSSANITVTVNPLPVVTISGETEICLDECTELTAEGGLSYEWLGLGENGYTCEGAFYVGGQQGGAIQSLYTIKSDNTLNEVGSLGTNNVNGIGYYCESGNRPYIYGMKMVGTSITEAVRANFVRINPETAAIDILGEIPQPPNPYGITGTTGIMAFIADVSDEGVYYFPAVAALINPFTFEIVDYTIYLGKIDVNNHGNGSNVTYTPLGVQASCQAYMDACIAAFQAYALNPSGGEPSGGIQDWALSPDGQILYSFFGIENGLFSLDINTNSVSCVAGPSGNEVYTGQTGAQTDEFGGIYFSEGELFGLQVDRGRLFSINIGSGALTLVNDNLPINFRGDNARCYDCGNIGTGGGATSESVIVCPEETTTYTVVVTDGNGCVNTGTVTVTVNPLPVVTISGDTEICVGESTTLTASGGSNYTWSNGTTTTSITVNPIVTTTYGVTVSDGNGCESTGSVTVIVNPLPTPTIVGDTEICLGESTNLGVFGGVSYVWSNGSTTAAINVSPLVTTLYSVTVTDGKGCSAVVSTTVTVNPLPNAAITGDTEICVGEETTLYASGGASYVWSNGETTYWIDVNPLVTTTYSVTVTDVNGCKASTSTTVTVNPLPVVTISGDTEICVGESTTLTASGGSNYSWSNGATTASIEVSPSVTTTYNVVVTDGNGCRSTSSVTVIVNPLPIVSISGDNAICIGDNTTLTASGGSSYVWSTGATTSSINVSPIATTSYGVTVTDGAGCTSSANITVTVNPLPVVTISGETEICLDECTELTAEGGLSYEWLGLGENGYTCEGAFYVGGQQGGAIQSLYTIKSDNTLNEVGSLGTNNVNGIGYYCESGNRPYIYGMKMVGTSITEAVRANFVRINPETAAIDILGEIPQPPNPYGITGTTGIMAFIADVSDEGVYYFPAVAALINPFTFEIVDYTIYLGKIDVNNHGNGSNVTYTPLGVQASCQAYMDACIAAFQAYALNPSGGEPSGGIQDWALSPDGQILYSFFGIENGLFSLDINTNSVSCVAGPSGNEVYTGQTGAQTDEFGGIYFSEGELFGLQVDRGRLYSINIGSGALTLVNNNLPINFRGDNARCYDCGNIGTGGGATSESVIVCPDETTTYTVVVTDGNGCVNTGTVTVTVNPLPVVTISGDTEICVGESTTLTASGGSNYTWSNGATTTSITVNPIVTTTYGVTVSDGNGCESTGSVTVIVNPLPTPTIVGDTEICLGESTNLGVFGGVSYVWSNGSTTAAINVSPLVTTLYSVTVTDGKGCSAVVSTTVTVNPLPNAAITGDTEICVGEETTLYASGGASYVWSNGETTYWIDVNPLVTTTYSVTVTDVNGCKASTSTTVTVNPLPVVTISGDTEICVGESTTLTASGGNNYTWSNGATTASIEVSPSVTTTYNVVVTDGNGCRSTSSVTVIVNPLPIASISGDNAICIGDNTTLTASGGTSYVWSTGATTASINVSPIATTSYGVTVTDGAGCTSSASITVTVNPLPVVTISGDTEICLGETTTLIANGGTSYIWSNGSTTAAINVNPIVNTLYSVTVTDANGCSASTNITVIVNPLPTATITGNSVICEGDSTLLTADGGITYLWSNGSTTKTVIVSPLVTTTYTVTVTNIFGCINTASIIVSTSQKPDIIITGIDKICKGDSSIIVATAFSNVECPGVCEVESPQVIAYWALDACSSFMNLGTHMDYSEFKPIITNPNCTSVAAGNVHRINGNKHSCTPGPESVAMCIGSQKTCNPSKLNFSQSLRFEVELNPAQGGTISGLQFYEQSPEVYQWVDGASGPNNFATKYVLRVSKNGDVIYYDDQLNTNRTWGLVEFDFSDNPNFATLGLATYLFELVPYCTVNNGAIESVWDIDEIKVLGGCCNATTSEIASYEWSNGETGPSITVKPTETTSYTVTVTDCNGCSNVEEYEVVVNCLMADLGPDKMINLGETLVLTPIITGKSSCSEDDSLNTIKYLWSTGETTPSITVTPSSSTFYRVTVIDCNDCRDTESLSIHVMMARPIITYPNPATERVNISSEIPFESDMSIRILSLDNSVIFDSGLQMVKNTPTNATLVFPSNIVNGVYILEIKNGDRIYTDRIIILK